MSKQGNIFDEIEGMPLKTGHLHILTGTPKKYKSIKVKDWDMNQKPMNEDANPFEYKKSVEKTMIGGGEKAVNEDGTEYKGPTAVYRPKKKQDDTPSGKSIPTVKQVILGNVPSKSNCYKIITFKSKDPEKSHASLGKTKALKQYENDFFIQANRYRNLNVDEYFEFEIDVYYPTQRSDLDNSLKVVLDCLQKINAIKNDNKCTRIVANKFLDNNNPRIEFIIRKSM